MKNIYIVLSMSGTRFSKFLVKMRPNMIYPHVSISFKKDLSTLYSFGRQNYYFPFIAGFVEEHPDSGVFARYPAKIQMIEVPVSDFQYHLLQSKIMEYQSHSHEYSYNFLGLAYTYFGIPQQLDKKYTCTQFVSSLLDAASIEITNKPPSLIISNDYIKIENSKIIYNGLLQNIAS